MGLTAFDPSNTAHLAALAASPRGTRRDDIYLAVASLYRAQGPLLSERERSLMREILRRLAGDVEMAIRIATAEKIADDPNAPLDLILLLVDDKIEVARPLILRSQRLTDAELLNFIAEADEARQALCAERPHIGEPVTAALAKSDAEPVLVALVRNLTARIADGTFATLVEKSKALASLQEPLVNRGDMPPVLATRMCDRVSDALKTHLVGRTPLQRAAANDAIEQASKDVQSPSHADVAEGSRKLIDKLAAAGQLKAGFLLRVLHQGQMDLFELAFAKLLQTDFTSLRRILYEGGPRSVALACRAVGIDRCVFPTVYNLSRQSRRMHPLLTQDGRIDAEAVFNAYTKAEALARLRAS